MIMRFKILSLTVFALMVAGPSAHAWTDLFNGKNLKGWTQKTGNADYYVEDGCIVGRMKVPGIGTNSFLCTTKDYDNFILELDFKADPDVNTGVQIRSQFADKPVSFEWKGKGTNIGAGYVYGYQIEVDTDLKGKTWTGALYDERRRRTYIDPPGGPAGVEGRAFTALNRQITRTNDWNHLRIEAVGDSIKTYLNGVLRANTNDSMTAKGFIGLQIHNSKDTNASGALARFKNIRLQRVSPKPVAPEPPPNTLTEQEKKDGWRLLWDGKTTAGWRSATDIEFPKQSWTIRNGELCVTNNNGGESAVGGDIITTRKFSDFDLLVDFKLSPGCNSGIKYFVQPNLKPITTAGIVTNVGSAIGLEYQILDDERHPDAKLGRNGDRTLGSLYDLMPADKDKKPHFIGEWNTARIRVAGNRVEYWLNGDKILSFKRGSSAFRRAVADSKYKNIPEFGEWESGNILLQEHGSPVSFRNIKIRVPED
jgi:3-keto-disaccharide hydrolase